MYRNGRVLLTALVVLMGLARTSDAANRITCQSKIFDPSSSNDTVGFLIENDIDIQGLVLPIELRTIDGAYIASGPSAFGNTNPRWQEKSNSRLALSPLGTLADPDEQWPAANVTRTRYSRPHPTDSALCTTAPYGTYSTNAPGGAIDGVSPDAFLYATVSTGDPGFQLVYLTPGADATPSIELIFSVGVTEGHFQIDTCCVRPANHASFVDASVQNVAIEFVKGTITVGNAVKELETGVIPQDYSLEQNYPNPFNAGTVIRFAQPVDGKVKIDVYDILGRRVRNLVDEFRVAGTHQTDWDGRSDDGIQVATGVYFYRITTEGFTSTRKMVLLK